LRLDDVSLELPRESVGVLRSSGAVADHQVERRIPGVTRDRSFLVLRNPMRFECLDRRRVERDRAPTSVGLRRSDHELVVHGGDRLRHRYTSSDEVDVSPPQTEHFAATHPGGGEH